MRVGPPSISADGRLAAWLATDGGPAELVVRDLASGRISVRSTAAARCRTFSWSYRAGTGIALADPDGGECPRLFRVCPAERIWTPLGPPASGRLTIVGLSPDRPDEVLVADHSRDPAYPDYAIVSLVDGVRTPVFRNDGYATVYFDRRFVPRLTETVTDGGARELRHVGRLHELFLRIPAEEALCVRVLEFSADGEDVLVVRPRGERGMRLSAIRCRLGRPADAIDLHRVIDADITAISTRPGAARPDLLRVEGARPRSVALDHNVRDRLTDLRHALGHAPDVLERRDGDRVWLLATRHPLTPSRYFVHDARGRLIALDEPHDSATSVCRPVTVPVRDGRRMPAYLTRPALPTDRPRPAVLLVHGGPWRRSGWSLSPRRAFLAGLGYTVIEPNFRGSTGFGAGWINAADREWGGAMQRDLEDALDWSVSHGFADADRIAFFGGSYGGYAVLQAAATSSWRPKAVVATSPLTDLVRFVEDPPPTWRSAVPMLRRRIGDPRDPEQRRRLAETSPILRASGITSPVLLVHGVNDVRVPADMVSGMFLALARSGGDAMLALLPDEGHEIAAAGNAAAVDRLIAAHLAAHLGAGPARIADEEITKGSSMRLLRTPNVHRKEVSPDGTTFPARQRAAAART
jgi:acetyl esterase/lipase